MDTSGNNIQLIYCGNSRTFNKGWNKLTGTIVDFETGEIGNQVFLNTGVDQTELTNITFHNFAAETTNSEWDCTNLEYIGNYLSTKPY